MVLRHAEAAALWGGGDAGDAGYRSRRPATTTDGGSSRCGQRFGCVYVRLPPLPACGAAGMANGWSEGTFGSPSGHPKPTADRRRLFARALVCVCVGAICFFDVGPDRLDRVGLLSGGLLVVCRISQADSSVLEQLNGVDGAKAVGGRGLHR